MNNTQADGKIVGGAEAEYGLYPFAVSLKIRTVSRFYHHHPRHQGYHHHHHHSHHFLRRYLHFCGGAAITTSAVLTAAHCIAVGITITITIIIPLSKWLLIRDDSRFGEETSLSHLATTTSAKTAALRSWSGWVHHHCHCHLWEDFPHLLHNFTALPGERGHISPKLWGQQL